jgi:hypothetical protein
MAKTKAQKEAEAANEVDGQEFDREGNPKFQVTDEGTQVERDENGDPVPVGGDTESEGEEAIVYSPETHVCLDGAYVEHPDAKARPRTLNVGGQNFEHTDTDANGVWMYRRM